MYKIKSIATLVIVCGFMLNCFAHEDRTEIIYELHKNLKTNKDEWKVAALINMGTILNKSGDGCGQRMTFAKISALQFSDSGNSINLIQLKEESGRVFGAPIKYQKLSNLERQTADTLFIQGNEYFVFYQVCGSGGFVSLINVYSVDGLLGEK